MSLHQEINFETEIGEYLAANGWLYAEGDAAKYDRARAVPGRRAGLGARDAAQGVGSDHQEPRRQRR